MPPLSPSKRPGLLHWLGFAVVVLLTVWFLNVVFTRSGYAPMMYGERVSSQGIYKMGSSIAAAPGMPPMAVEPMMDAEDAKMMLLRGESGGSATQDLDGNAIEPRIIKTGELALRVEDAPASIEHIRGIVTGVNGFVESSSISDTGSGPRTAWITVRIPVDRFEAALKDIKAVATLVLNESIHGQDVTSEFVDLEADIRNAKAEEASYLEILKRSGDISDVLAVTQRLAEVRGRIERLEGRKRYLENRTDLATLNITVTEETRIEVPTRTWKPFSVLREAVNDTVVALQELVDFFIRIVVASIGILLPIALFTGFIIWIGWKAVKGIMRRFTKK
jgi:hypothetical protein